MRDDALDWLRRRDMIDDCEQTAGKRMAQDFEMGIEVDSLRSNWREERHGRGVAAETNETTVSARARIESALRAIGPELFGVIVEVCCWQRGLEAIETDQGWPKRSAKVVLRIALQSLARHYGLSAEVTGPCRDVIHAWRGD